MVALHHIQLPNFKLIKIKLNSGVGHDYNPSTEEKGEGYIQSLRPACATRDLVSQFHFWIKYPVKSSFGGEAVSYTHLTLPTTPYV